MVTTRAVIVIFVLVLVRPGYEAPLFIRPRDGVVKEEAKEAPHEHTSLQEHPDDLIKLLIARHLEPGVLLDPLRQGQGEEEGEAEDEEVPGGVEVDELEVGEAHGRDHAEHDTEDAANDGAWDGQEQGA